MKYFTKKKRTSVRIISLQDTKKMVEHKQKGVLKCVLQAKKKYYKSIQV